MTTTGVLSSAASQCDTYLGPPGAPTITGLTPGDTRMMVTFSKPASDGGSLIIGYTVTSRPGNATAGCLRPPCVFSGLTNGVNYTFTVAAQNAIGRGPASAAFGPASPLGEVLHQRACGKHPCVTYVRSMSAVLQGEVVVQGPIHR